MFAAARYFGRHDITHTPLRAALQAGLSQPRFMRTGRLKSSSTLKYIDKQHNDRDYEQEMDQAAANVAYEAKEPEHDQDDNYGPKRGQSFRFS